MSTLPYISIVVVTRNDNHGESLNYRTQEFIDLLALQCTKFQIQAELLIVEWNPPQKNPKLAEQFTFPSTRYLAIKIIEVPEDIHNLYQFSKHQALYQMIGKNVGIKRASGRYILATNIDIIFSDKTFFYIKNKLDESHVYTAIRHDIPSQLPLNMNKIKWASKNFFRVHHTLGSIQIKKSSHLFYNLFGFFYAAYVIYLKKMLEELTRNFTFASANPAQQKWGGDICNQIRKIKGCFIKVNSILVLASEHLQVVYKKPHTNACGDFTLCSKKIWDVLRGYPEWDTMSWHLDSIYIYQAKNSGFPIKKVGGKIFHIEHSPGSGYTPEHAELLFDRLRQKGISFLSNEEFQDYIDQQEKTSAPIIYNPKNWGLSDLNLTETVISKIDL